MRLQAKVVWLFVVGMLPIDGCNEVTSPPALDLVITDAAGLLEGVQVCEGDTDDNCEVSDVNGKVALDVPIDQEIFYTLKKEGYDSLVFAEVVPETGSSRQWYLSTDEEIAPLYDEVDLPYPRRGTGQIVVFLDPGFAGATFKLIDATGKVYYEVSPYDPPPFFDLDLEATTEDGVGHFLEVTPARVSVELGGTVQRCVPDTAWPGDVEDSNRVRVPVLEDHASIVYVNCQLPP